VWNLCCRPSVRSRKHAQLVVPVLVPAPDDAPGAKMHFVDWLYAS
jgi:hypothetical protein